MKYEYFIASRWRNKEQVLDLARKLEAKSKRVYNFIEADGAAYQLKDVEQKHTPEEFMKQFESIPDWWKDPSVREIFEVDMAALRDSEKLILLLPSGKSAHIEAGVAFGMEKPCIVIGEQKEAETPYLIFNEHHDSIDEFITNLK